MSIVYESDAARVVELAPLDPNGVKLIQLNITPWLNGASLTAQTWSAPTNITIGDGVATKTTPNGTATPAAPSETGGTISAYVFAETAAAKRRRYVVTASLKASDGKEDDRSFGFELAER